jgi:ABC-type lipoprotein export system ATPase subunit
MTKTFRPVFRLPDAAALDEEPAAALDAADDDELEELEEQAASATATGIASASHDARLSFMSLYPFNSRVEGFLE